MKKLAALCALVLIGGVVTASAQPDPVPVGTVDTIYGTGGYIEIPGQNRFCPNPGTSVCAVITHHPGGGETWDIYGRGGVVQIPGGWHHCPEPAPTLCSRIVRPAPVDVPGGRAMRQESPGQIEISVYDPSGAYTTFRRADNAGAPAPGSVTISGGSHLD